MQPKGSFRGGKIVLLLAGAALGLMLLLPVSNENGVQTTASLPPPRLAASARSGVINLCVATDEEEPFGLLALINSTVVHAAVPTDLRFHLIVPQASRRRLRLLLEALFTEPSFHMYTLDVGGARSKIVRHLRRREREPVLVSPYRYALAYLPHLLPGIRRLLWLQLDVLVLADVRSLFETPLHGAPVGLVEDCSRRAARRFNSSRASMVGALPVDACDVDGGVVLVDVQQWALLDLTARVEYWLSLNLRSAPFFAHDDAHAPMLLALLPVYMRLPPEWAVGGLGDRRIVSSEESVRSRQLLSASGYKAVYGSQRRVIVLGAFGGNAVDGRVAPAKAVHYSGPLKPWLKNGNVAGALCVHPLTNWSSPELIDSSSTAVACAELWNAYARSAISTLRWTRLTLAEAARTRTRAAAAAAVVNAEDEDPLALPLLEADPLLDGTSDGGGNGQDANANIGGAPDGNVAYASKPTVHVTIVNSDATPYGLFALINSTLTHASDRTRSRLQLRVIARAEQRQMLARKLRTAFPANVNIEVSGPPEERLSKLGARLQTLGIDTDPFELPQLWVHHAACPRYDCPH
jgi:hypothetical protein